MRERQQKARLARALRPEEHDAVMLRRSRVRKHRIAALRADTRLGGRVDKQIRPRPVSRHDLCALIVLLAEHGDLELTAAAVCEQVFHDLQIGGKHGPGHAHVLVGFVLSLQRQHGLRQMLLRLRGHFRLWLRRGRAEAEDIILLRCRRGLCKAVKIDGADVIPDVLQRDPGDGRVVEVVEVADNLEKLHKGQLQLFESVLRREAGLEPLLQLRKAHTEFEDIEFFVLVLGQEVLHIEQHLVLRNFPAAVCAVIIVRHSFSPASGRSAARLPALWGHFLTSSYAASKYRSPQSSTLSGPHGSQTNCIP